MTRATRQAGLALVLFVTASVVVVATAAAQYRHRPQHRPREIRCESQSRRSTYCPTYTHGRVVLQRQLSNTRCREYDTWGADADGGGVWVWDGCRAIFAVLPWGGPGRPPGSGYGGPGPGRKPVRITCRSDRFRPQYCPIPRYGRIELERRLSDAPCRRYDTWGSDGGGIWVDRGCQAIFIVR
jgi:hypothetical protein